MYHSKGKTVIIVLGEILSFNITDYDISAFVRRMIVGAYICFTDHITIANKTSSNGALSQIGYKEVNDQVIRDLLLGFIIHNRNS